MHACQRSRLLLIGELACFDEALACRDNQDWCRGRILYSKLGGGNLSVLPLPIKKVATKTAAQAIK